MNFYQITNKKKYFIYSIFIFFIFFIACFEFFLLYFKESIPFNYIDIEKKNILYGKKYAHTFDTLQYKIFRTNQLKKKNIIIGSSTSTTYEVGKLSEQFYNASKPNLKLGDITFILQNISYIPEKIIIILDPYHFNIDIVEISQTNYELINKVKLYFYNNYKEEYYFIHKAILHFQNYKIILNDIYENRKKIFNKKLHKKENIGFNGIVFNSGFQIDGSYIYPFNYHNKPAVDIRTYLQNFDKKNFGYFGSESQFDNFYKKKLDFIINNKKINKNVFLIILNTVDKNLLQALQKKNTTNVFLKKYKNICNYLQSAQVDCIDYTSYAQNNNISSNFFRDGYHYNEVVASQILKNLNKKLDIN
tara:strand:+ start:5000 stop:6082 length:1083 start_codon:yes stop_codon:yes gene_type:complete